MHLLHSDSGLGLGLGPAPTACLVVCYLTVRYFITTTLLSKMLFLFSPLFSKGSIGSKRDTNDSAWWWVGGGWTGFGWVSLDTKAFLNIWNQTNGCSQPQWVRWVLCDWSPALLRSQEGKQTPRNQLDWRNRKKSTDRNDVRLQGINGTSFGSISPC